LSGPKVGTAAGLAKKALPDDSYLPFVRSFGGTALAGGAGIYAIDRYEGGPAYRRQNKVATPEQKQEARTKYLNDAEKRSGRKFTMRDRFNAQVDLLRKTNTISAGQAQRAKAWAETQGRDRLSQEFWTIAEKYWGEDVQ
jgi:hypothetical protein